MTPDALDRAASGMVLFAWQIGEYVVIANVSGAPLSPWLLYHTHAQTTSLEEAVELVNARVLARRTGGR